MSASDVFGMIVMIMGMFWVLAALVGLGAMFVSLERRSRR